MTLGCIVGKFDPPHRGHQHLIETARAQVDRLVVVIAHHPSQSTPGPLRRAWLKEIHPDCEIHLVDDSISNDSASWARFTVEHLGRAPDVVFTSEDYGEGWAALMGCRHVLVDRERTVVPISATAIRASPLAHLDALAPCVRAHYVLRVVLIGAESTGKTTLAGQLAERFGTTWVAEYAREHWERKVAGLSMDGPLPQWTPDEFVHIAREQQRRENAAARSAHVVLFCDTNAFATGTWHERYRGKRERRVDAIGARDRADLYLLTAPDVPFVQDGVRDGETIRDWMHERFLAQLRESNVPFVIISGPHESRLGVAAEAVEKLLRERGVRPCALR